MIGRAGSGLAAVVVLVLIAVVGVPMLASWQAQKASCATDANPLADPVTGADLSVPLPAGAAGAPLTVQMGTWNVWKSNSSSRILAGLRELSAAGADVIGVQELQSYHRGIIAAGMRQAGWSMTTGNTATPMFWRTNRYTVLAQGQEKEFGVVRIEGGGAAGSSVGPKSIAWVQLQDRVTKAVFIAANHHLVPTIETHGHPNRQGPKRVAYAQRQITAAGQLADRLSRGRQIPFLISADWNVDARKDAHVRTSGFPYVALQRYGLYSNWRTVGYPKGGTQTHGSRLIDAIFSTNRTVAPVGQQILDRHGSDHRAVLVQYTNRRSSAMKPVTLTTTDAVSTTAPVAGASIGQVGGLPQTLTVPSATSGSTLQLRGEQVANAAIIIAEGRAAGIPPYGWVIAIATALQESRLRNLRYGDRDSQGLFQQRPSAGWGTVEQIRDPHLAARAFFGVADHTDNRGLSDIPGWASMSIAAAAQAVQVSAFPDAYTKWDATARAIVLQLSDSPAPSSSPSSPCGSGQNVAAQPGECPATGTAVEQGLTPDALLVLRCTKANFPTLTEFGGRHPDPLPDHPSGRAVDIMIPSYRTTDGQAFGWQVAHWLHDHRTQLGIQYLIFDAKIWSVERDSEGWRDYRPGYTSSLNDSSLHRNHVHVTVYGNTGTDLLTVHDQEGR